MKAAANPRHVTLFEVDEGGVYRWAFKHAEEVEVVLPDRYVIEAYYVVEGECLAVVAEHQSPDDARWADGLVRDVQFLRDCKVPPSGSLIQT